MDVIPILSGVQTKVHTLYSRGLDIWRWAAEPYCELITLARHGGYNTVEAAYKSAESSACRLLLSSASIRDSLSASTRITEDPLIYTVQFVLI